MQFIRTLGNGIRKNGGSAVENEENKEFLRRFVHFSQLPCPVLVVNILMLSASTLIALADTIRVSADSLIVSTDTLRKGTFPECYRNGRREKL